MDEAWKVNSQQERTVVDPTSGQAVDVVRVTFTTRHGHTGTVDVPKNRYGVETVTHAVDRYAEILDEVGHL